LREVPAVQVTDEIGSTESIGVGNLLHARSRSKSASAGA
jgi:hypothetical protein